MLKVLYVLLLVSGMAACDDSPEHDHQHDADTGHDIHDENLVDVDNDAESRRFCTLTQQTACKNDLGAGAFCCESTRSCYAGPCTGDCCPLTE